MLFIDMDGVIAKYEPKDYLTRPFPFEHPNSYYFLHRECVENVKEALHLCSPMIPFAFLSTIGAPSLSQDSEIIASFYAQWQDKRQWLINHMFDLSQHPFISARLLPLDIFSDNNRRTKPGAACQCLKQSCLTKNDVLVDNFEENLKTWDAAGGRSIKFYNGINSPSDAFETISVHMSAAQLRDKFLSYANYNS